MMKQVFTLLTIFLLFFISCNKESDTGYFKLGSEANFKMGNLYQSVENNLRFKVVDINDSRCPSDVECIWQGEAEVHIHFEKPFEASLVLSTYDNMVDTVGNYAVKLVDVFPYPISTKVIDLDEYKVTLRINNIED